MMADKRNRFTSCIRRQVSALRLSAFARQLKYSASPIPRLECPLMRLFACKTVLCLATLFLGFIVGSEAQSLQSASSRSPAPVPAAGPAAPAFENKNYLPAGSTEKLNGDCFVNIDRRYPISKPTFQMNRGAHISVYIF